MTTWHYLPVYQDVDWKLKGEPQTTRSYGFIKVYLDDDGNLECWTEWENPEKGQAPYGQTIEELRGDLGNMLNDINRWQPENYVELKEGMALRRNEVKALTTCQECGSDIKYDSGSDLPIYCGETCRQTAHAR